MTFGLQSDEETSVAVLDTAADAGVTFIDTADVYPLGGGLDTVGRTEEILGRWLEGRRSEFIVATKCVGRTGPREWDQGASRRHILDAIDASLRRLGTDYVDLYQLHGFDPRTPIDETLEALDIVVRSGRARYVGCSNFLAYRVARAIGRSEVLGLVRFVSVQPRYNLIFRQPERELFPFCEEEGLGVIPYNPLAGGLLSGKYEWSETPPTTGRFALGTAGKMYVHRYWHEHELKTAAELAKIAAEAGTSAAKLAVGWVAADPVVSAVIIGASRPEQLADTLDAVDEPMDPVLRARLDELTVDYRKGDAPK
jgi:aryl-alcohol dehydrogenase (NADP+)